MAIKNEAKIKDIAHLCDIAIDGDRGIVCMFPQFELAFKETTTSGGDVCRLVFTRKSGGVR